jgi:DNA-binding response OmpR family regulator
MEDDGSDDLARVLRESRDRFVSGFPDRCDEIRARIAARASADDIRARVHRLVGLAGTIGFPTVSKRAADLEDYFQSHGTYDTSAALNMMDGVADGFGADGAAMPEWSTGVSTPAAEPLPESPMILVVEDDPDQASVMAAALEQAGFRVTTLSNADTLLEVALAVTPAVVILDVMLPGIDGLLACRLLKGEPELASIPVVFVSSRTALDERLAAVALGAADYLTKPVDLGEVVFRLRRLIAQTSAATANSTPVLASSDGDAHEYPEFVRLASAVLKASPATVVLIRVDAGARSQLLNALVPELRRRDVIGDYDRRHVVVIYPELPAASALARLRPLLERLAANDIEVRAGVAESPAAGSATLDDLLAKADAALAEARFKGVIAARHGEAAVDMAKSASHRLLLADDDPDVMRIVDAQMRAQHFKTTLVFDGEAALAALASQPYDLVVLDLMLPKRTGFEVLQGIRELPTPPRVVVLSARGREEDITRAFQLGADDYVTKPFRPQELAARVVRLLR